MGAYQQHSLPGGKLRTVLELGCGPANHAIQLAKRGVQAWALDNNAHMLQYAADKAAAAGAAGLTTVQGDMASFSVQVRTAGACRCESLAVQPARSCSICNGLLCIPTAACYPRVAFGLTMGLGSECLYHPKAAVSCWPRSSLILCV